VKVPTRSFTTFEIENLAFENSFKADLNHLYYRHATQIESSTSVFRSTSNGDPKKTRKIDEIKQKLVAILREILHCTNPTFSRLTIVHAGEIGFSVPKDRLPWSTLEGDLEKQGYAIHNWPQGVVRERDKGVYILSAEEADKLYHVIFSDERRRIQFVRRGGGTFLRRVVVSF
jgi:hypothetical protein